MQKRRNLPENCPQNKGTMWSSNNWRQELQKIGKLSKDCPFFEGQQEPGKHWRNYVVGLNDTELFIDGVENVKKYVSLVFSFDLQLLIVRAWAHG